ncbi:hypothetical protein XH97_00095 [Bradyrhizobium sp. CCBAU 53380]|nr:hypothetical protein [Bradyrhizobium sp. CCBAU 53380]
MGEGRYDNGRCLAVALTVASPTLPGPRPYCIPVNGRDQIAKFDSVCPVGYRASGSCCIALAKNDPSGGESGTLYPDAAIAQNTPKNKNSGKARPRIVTTAVYHLTGRFGGQPQSISSYIRPLGPRPGPVFL